MVATDFEFRHRFWIIVLIFSVAFYCYAIDPMPMAVFALHMIYGGVAKASAVFSKGRLREVYAISAVLALLAAALRTWATAYLHKDVVFDQALHSERLVADGPYRYVRNPLYLGGLLLTAGMGLFASRLGFVMIIVLMWFFYRRLIGREEMMLERAGPDAFRKFCAAVPRLWPALSPQLPAAGGKPHYGQAFYGELFMWGFAAVTIVFTVTEDLRWVSISCGVIVLLRGLSNLRNRGKAKSSGIQAQGE